jgi:hypothetical protein
MPGQTESLTKEQERHIIPLCSFISFMGWSQRCRAAAIDR